MTISVNFDVAAFKKSLSATKVQIFGATRPAAQAGIQIIYDRARINAPVSKRAHMFHIEGRVYGPFLPGNLRDSIYQVFSKNRSYLDVSTYEVSWNKDEAPYGYAYEFGNSKKASQSFIARSVIETRAEVRAIIKARYIEEVNK